MKTQLLLLLAAGLVSGHVIPTIKKTVIAPAPVVVTQAVSSQYHAQDEIGQYTYGYSGGPSAKHETKTADGVTSGGYSYIDGNGLVQSAAYVSDPVNGFRVAATNLPAGPAVPTSGKAAVVAAAPVVVARPAVAAVATGPAVVAAAPAAVVSNAALVASPVATVTAAPIVASRVATVTAAPIIAAPIYSTASSAKLISSRTSVVATGPIVAAPVLAATPIVAATPVVASAPVVAAAPVLSTSSYSTHGATVSRFGVGTVSAVTPVTPLLAHPTPAHAVTILQSGNAAVHSAAAANAAIQSAAAANAAAANAAAANAAAANAAAANAAAADAAAANAAAAASAKAAAQAELLQAAERVAAAKAASIPAHDTLEVIHAKHAHLAEVEAAKVRNAVVAAKDAHENAIITSGPAVVGGSALLAARPATIVATAPAVVGKVAISSAGPSVVTVTSAPPVVSVSPAIVATAAPVVVSSVAPAIAVARTAALVTPSVRVVAPAVVTPTVGVVAPALGVAKTATIVATPGVAVAKTALVGSTVAVNPVVSTQYHAQDELGQYTFGYSGGPSAKHETKTIDGVTRGGYSYIDAHGQVQSAAYVSDPVNGFRVAATNIPVQPGPKYIADSAEIAEAKAKLFHLQAEHIAKL